MSTLLDRRGPGGNPRSPRLDAASPLPAATAALVAVQAAAASLSVILLPVVLAWASASFSDAPWGRALQFGVGTWLLAHHAGIVIPAGHVGLVPLGLMAIPVVCCWLAGVRLARNLDPNAADLREGVGRARPVMPPARALVTLIATYAGLVTVASVLATSVAVRPLAAQALVGALVICGIAGTCGAAAWAQGGLIPGIRWVLRRARPPHHVTRVLPALLVALGVQLAGGLIVVIAALVIGWDRVLLLHHALSPGIAGGIILILGQLTVLPNLVIWAVSVCAGPGFAVGAHSAVTAGSTSLGLVPAVPVLGALPDPGAHPVWAYGLLALPPISGVVLGVLLARRDPEAGVLDVLADVGRVTLLTGVLWALLGWLSAGPAGPGRLGDVGPSAWRVALCMTGEVGAGALVGAGILLAVWHFTHDGAADEADDQIIDLTDDQAEGEAAEQSSD